MLKKLMHSRRLLLVPVVLVAAAGIATESGALPVSSASRAARTCFRLDNQEARQEFQLTQVNPNSRRAALLQFEINRTDQREAANGCGD